MIVRSRGGDARMEARMFEGTDTIPPPSQAGSSWSHAGQPVTIDSATGIPVVLSAIRIIAESMAMLTKVTQEKRDGVWQVADDAPEQRWLDQPHEEITPSAWWAYALAAINGWGYFTALKSRSLLRPGEVLELHPMLPANCTPCIEKGELVFKVRDEADPSAKPQTLTSHDVFHIPGVLLHPRLGTSPIHKHRHAIGQQQALEEWMGRFYQNDGTPSTVVTLQGNPPSKVRDEFRESWAAMHQGSGKAHGMGLLWGGATFDAIGISPKDAEYVASANLGVQQVARIFRMDSGLLNDPSSAMEKVTPEHTSIRFVTFTLGYWVARCTDALRYDADLFPEPKLRRPAFLPDALTMVDFATRAQGWHALKQDGIATANEARPQFGLPPHDDGDTLQITPVGGGANGPAADPNDPAGEQGDKPPEAPANG